MKDDFRRRLIGKLTEFNSIVNSINMQKPESISLCIDNFTSVLKEVADPLFSKMVKVSKPRSVANNAFRKADWFDSECREGG